jgi:hypothetical protein
VQLRKLVLRECLGGEEVERSRIALFEDGIQNGQVVAKRLARGSRRHDHKILACVRELRSLSLMRKELPDPFRAVSLKELRPYPRGHVAKPRLAGGQVPNSRQHLVGLITPCEASQHVLERIQGRACLHDRQSSTRRLHRKLPKNTLLLLFAHPNTMHHRAQHTN